MTGPVIVERTYDAPASIIWKALTDSTEMKKWYFDIPVFKPEVGFKFQFYGQGKSGEKFLHLCEVTDVSKNKLLRHTWRYDGYEGVSYVTWELSDENGKTKVTVTHEGLDTFPKTPHDDFARESFVQGWSHILGTSLKKYLENGN